MHKGALIDQIPELARTCTQPFQGLPGGLDLVESTGENKPRRIAILLISAQKHYVVVTHNKCLDKALLMSTHNI